MRTPFETESARIQDVVCATSTWDARTTLTQSSGTAFHTLSARSVELIAQPGKVGELRTCVQSALMEHLKKQRGFAGAVVLNSLKEPRLILVMSLWKAEKYASGNRWETSAAVLAMISPLIDVCSKVQTYEAAMPSQMSSALLTIVNSVC